MKYRKLGNTGLVVSAVTLGTMQFGNQMNMGRLGQEETSEMISFSLSRGINCLDTADVYSLGESETLIGNAIKGIRDELILATKVRLPMSDNINRCGATRKNIMQGVESSLKRLQTDYIDLYQIHGWDSSTPMEETVRTMDDLVRQGKVRYIGFSNYLAWQAAASIEMQKSLNLEKYATAQMHYSLVNRGIEDEFISFAGAYNIGMLIWSPLAGGFLSGKYEKNKSARKGTRFEEAGQFVPFDKDRGFAIVDILKDMAAKREVSPARIALAWLLAKPRVSSLIIGARKIEHLDDNIKAVDLELTPDEIAKLDEISFPGTPYPKWMVLQLDRAEDPRTQIVNPGLYNQGKPWEDLRGTKWQG